MGFILVSEVGWWKQVWLGKGREEGLGIVILLDQLMVNDVCSRKDKLLLFSSPLGFQPSFLLCSRPCHG